MSDLSPGCAGPLMLGGDRASAPVREFAPLAAELVAHFARTDSNFNSFSMEAVRKDLTAVTAQGLRLAIRLMDERLEPTDGELEGIRRLTVKQARSGVPLSAILKLTDDGISAIRTLIVSRAASGDDADLKELNRLIFSLAQRLHTMISVSYLAAPSTAAGSDDEVRRSMIAALLAGGDPTPLALQLGVALAPTYLVLRVAPITPPAPRFPEDREQPRVQPRQLLAAAQRQIAAIAGASALEAPHPHQGLVLLAGTPDWDGARQMITQVGRYLGVEITAVAEQAALDALPAAVVHTRELALLTHKLRQPAGLYRMDDLAVEYQLTRCGPGRDRLTRLLDPLDGTPELLETLSIHLANDQNRQRTASTLGVHTNTVDNRIKRIVQLTGLDPTRSTELLKLRAASIAKAFTTAD